MIYFELQRKMWRSWKLRLCCQCSLRSVPGNWSRLAYVEMSERGGIYHLHNPGHVAELLVSTLCLSYPNLRFLLHPVDTHNKDYRRQQAALPDRFRQVTTVNNLTRWRYMKVLKQLNKLWWNSIVVHKLPDDIPVNTVEGLFEISKSKVCIQA